MPAVMQEVVTVTVMETAAVPLTAWVGVSFEVLPALPVREICKCLHDLEHSWSITLSSPWESSV